MGILFENKILKDLSRSALQLYLRNVHMQNILKIDSYVCHKTKMSAKLLGKCTNLKWCLLSKHCLIYIFNWNML